MSARHRTPRHTARRRLRTATGTAVAGLALSLGGVITAHATGASAEEDQGERESLVQEGVPEVGSAEGAWEYSVGEGTPDVTSPEGAWEQYVGECARDATSPEGTWEYSVGECPLYATSPEGEWETPVPGE